MAFGSILRGLGQRAMSGARGLGQRAMGSQMGQRAAGLGDAVRGYGSRMAQSPIGQAAANIGQAGSDYAKLGMGKAINQISRQFGVDEETARRILMGLGGTAAVGTGLAMSGESDPNNPLSSYYNYPKVWGEAPEGERWHSDPSSTGGTPPWLRDRFGFGMDARQLTDDG